MIAPAISPAILPQVISPLDRLPGPMLNVVPGREHLIFLMEMRGGVLQPDIIGLLITNDQVRTELMALFFYGATKYDDATIAANIAASSGLLNMYELIGDGDIAYALYAIGTPQATLNRAIRYFYSRALFVNSEPLFIDGEILEVA